MKQATQKYLNAINVRHAAKLAAGAMSLAAANAFAAIDMTDVETGLTAAQTSGESVGTIVIGVVAALAVVGVIIGLVRKL